MNGKTLLEEAILVSQIEEAIAQKLIAKYSTAFLSKIEAIWPCSTAIQILESSYLNILNANIRSSSQEITKAEAV
ncbi:MAG: hypothetical protein WB392_15090 [Methanotrichaceae archaeon]